MDDAVPLRKNCSPSDARRTIRIGCRCRRTRGDQLVQPQQPLVDLGDGNAGQVVEGRWNRPRITRPPPSAPAHDPPSFSKRGQPLAGCTVGCVDVARRCARRGRLCRPHRRWVLTVVDCSEACQRLLISWRNSQSPDAVHGKGESVARRPVLIRVAAQHLAASEEERHTRGLAHVATLGQLCLHRSVVARGQLSSAGRCSRCRR